ncbi:MAG: 5-formyltetrahydrofolate cyclo-ligase [Pyrinomonadaceae bacterium]
MKKEELRKLYLEKRSSLPVAAASTASGQIAERFFENIVLDHVNELHTFIRIARFNEIDTSVLFYRLWRDRSQIRTSAPRADLLSGEIESVAFDAATELAENCWRIREPVGGIIIAAQDLDIVLVPLLCFDKSGHRVGYGRGMYDQLLAQCRPDCLKVGLSYFPPVEVIDGVHQSDVKLDISVTPSAVYRFDGNNAGETP